MKKVLMGLVTVIVILCFGSIKIMAQEQKVDWKYNLNERLQKINELLNEEKPEEMKLSDYHLKVLDGEIKIKEETINAIQKEIDAIYEQGKTKVEKFKIEIEDETDIYFYGLTNPNVNLDGDLSGGEIWSCVAAAIGADILWSAGASTTATWSSAALTKAFKKIATRFLGPIGVIIAVVSFGTCIAAASAT